MVDGAYVPFFAVEITSSSVRSGVKHPIPNLDKFILYLNIPTAKEPYQLPSYQLLTGNYLGHIVVVWTEFWNSCYLEEGVQNACANFVP